MFGKLIQKGNNMEFLYEKSLGDIDKYSVNLGYSNNGEYLLYLFSSNDEFDIEIAVLHMFNNGIRPEYLVEFIDGLEYESGYTYDKYDREFILKICTSYYREITKGIEDVLNIMSQDARLDWETGCYTIPSVKIVEELYWVAELLNLNVEL